MAEDMNVTRGPSGKGQLLARVAGQEHYTFGSTTGLKLNDNCEDWMVPCDTRPGQTFDEWAAEHPPFRMMLESEARQVWDASRTRHTATLRRIGWLDQKGRVWTEVPASDEFDGGSLTPLLIDVRGDD
jgi:hypothetical protein